MALFRAAIAVFLGKRFDSISVRLIPITSYHLLAVRCDRFHSGFRARGTITCDASNLRCVQLIPEGRTNESSAHYVRQRTGGS